MKNSVVYTPPWVQNDIQSQLIGDEMVQTATVLTNYPLGLKKTYLAVTDKRLVGKQKTWFSSRKVDAPLRDITRVQIEASIKPSKILKTTCWALLSLFLFILIVPVVLTILNFLSIWEKEIIWTTRGYGSEELGGRRHSLEIIQRAIRENQIAIG